MIESILAIKNPLTPKEAEICRLFIENPAMPYKQLCEQVGIVEKTFSVHMSSIFRKLNVTTKSELYSKFVTSGKSPEDIILFRVLSGISEVERLTTDIRNALDSLMRLRSNNAS